MAIGERIKFFRSLKGMTQKFLGASVGFHERTADIRIAQYESGSRTPKAELTEALANTFGVSTIALNVPDIDTDLGLMHTLFALEDTYGFKIDKIDGQICLCLDIHDKNANSIYSRFSDWQKEAEKYRNGEISKEEYDRWRYTYPEVEAQRTRDEIDKLRSEKNN